MSTLSRLHTVHQEFTRNHPFESFTSNESAISREAILGNINAKIIEILDEVIDGGLALDIAFAHINALIYYATCTINTVIPNASDNIFMSYYHFLFYFLTFGCCLGTKYTKWMVLPQSYNNNDLLRYFVDKYTQNHWPRQMKYAFSDAKRQSIINNICARRDMYDIALLIADFTLFEFEEFVYVTTTYCDDWTSSENGIASQMDAYWKSFGFERGSALFMIPKLLLCPSFINCNTCTDVLYFANEMMFKCILWKPCTKHCKLIRNVFANHITIQPWNDATFFIQLFEHYANVYGEDAMLRLLQQCVAPGFDPGLFSHRKLTVFFDGTFCKMKESDRNLDLHNDIDVLFNEFVVKYGSKNRQIMNSLYTQMLYLKQFGNILPNGHERNAFLNEKVDHMTRIIDINYRSMQPQPQPHAVNRSNNTDNVNTE